MAALGSNKKASNLRMEAGSVALDGTNPTVVTTTFTAITACYAGMQDSVAPGLGTSIITTVKANVAEASTISIYAWKPTTSDDVTVIASTGTETVDWWAVGT